MHVYHTNAGDDGERHQDHREHQVLPDQGNVQRCGRHDLGDQQEEDGQRQQDGDAQRNLLAAVRRQVEDQDGQRGDEHAGDDQVDGVEQRLALDDEVVGQIHVGGVQSADSSPARQS